MTATTIQNINRQAAGMSRERAEQIVRSWERCQQDRHDCVGEKSIPRLFPTLQETDVWAAMVALGMTSL